MLIEWAGLLSVWQLFRISVDFLCEKEHDRFKYCQLLTISMNNIDFLFSTSIFPLSYRLKLFNCLLNRPTPLFTTNKRWFSPAFHIEMSSVAPSVKYSSLLTIRCFSGKKSVDFADCWIKVKKKWRKIVDTRWILMLIINRLWWQQQPIIFWLLLPSNTSLNHRKSSKIAYAVNGFFMNALCREC